MICTMTRIFHVFTLTIICKTYKTKCTVFLVDSKYRVSYKLNVKIEMKQDNNRGNLEL